ncbi:hypothetical protein [Faecalibaculum rodentium]|uniref:hypothetical protein n=1 Tax=Faecalibaculum rodentium TaxID=1702221 RepID=UPI00266F2D0E|nr:hypothetical protein [Faecalibaculum rodentium]
MVAIEILQKKLAAYGALWVNEDESMNDDCYEDPDIGLMSTTYDFNNWTPKPCAPAVLYEVMGEDDIPIELSYCLDSERYLIKVLGTVIFEEKMEFAAAVKEMASCSWDDYYSWTVDKIHTFLE